MRVAKIDIGYKATDLLAKFPELLANLAACELFGLMEGVTDVTYRNYVIDINRLDPRWYPALDEVTLTKNSSFIDNVQSAIGERPPAVNQHVHVAVPGNQLMNIKHVEVVLDMCTDMLGRKLAEGWCILAICPQPDQRRPDYVLGRSDSPD